ncbi:adhesion G protein-coupled receptor E5 isoform X2 [Mugil cephalus]|uniref:adhesion G protein-coupled receptor E5 isoform X2 n=1 Tax=Mugil cephalus TaxID=48193 RepID=UPI001FB79EDF|nr:adhesion G protein-coupled receptor E5 isoform X2 [Mugil cephalus]
MGFKRELIFLALMYALVKCDTCRVGLAKKRGTCVDIDECNDTRNLCGNDSRCFNTNGSYYCQCNPGYINSKGNNTNFTAVDGQCQDINECNNNKNICGPKASCSNLYGSYVCNCQLGYTNVSGKGCEDIDECWEAEKEEDDICGEKGTCKNLNGSYWCKCQKGYTNYGKERMPCSELNCNSFTPDGGPPQTLKGLGAILFMMRNSCLALSSSSAGGEGNAEGDALLEQLFTATEEILSPRHPGHLNSTEGMSGLLSTVEKSILFIGPQLKGNRTKIETTTADAEIAVQRGKTPPTGQVHLESENASLDIDWTTAAGTETYPGFAMAALLSYKNLETSMNHSFNDIKKDEDEDSVESSFQVFSKVVSVVVSNPSTDKLSHHVNITLRHLQVVPHNIEDSSNVSYICAYWDESGAWSTHGCLQQYSNETYTICTCNHLSSFAVLMARHKMKHTFGLMVVTKIGLIISLLCLILCILTFKFCRSIQGTRTTIHLHLCICLFMADLVFLAGISQTKPEGGCKFVAALLHFFFLGVFTWMLLEGVQLYRMVVLVFNASIRPLYLYVTGYGAPLVIVAISGIIRPQGYGTDEHCWLSLNNGLIWSFFGPVCIIIILNVFFFIITVWKLAQKFTSLNPDLSKLHKIKAFTVTAIAQMCILGLMWVFGAFLFEEDTTVVAYIFTILNSLQGALVFIMHCLLSKQVRDEYAHFLSCICAQEKKRYSDFSSTNPSSSQSQSQSGQHTGESHI